MNEISIERSVVFVLMVFLFLFPMHEIYEPNICQRINDWKRKTKIHHDEVNRLSFSFQSSVILRIHNVRLFFIGGKLEEISQRTVCNQEWLTIDYQGTNLRRSIQDSMDFSLRYAPSPLPSFFPFCCALSFVIWSPAEKEKERREPSGEGKVRREKERERYTREKDTQEKEKMLGKMSKECSLWPPFFRSFPSAFRLLAI